MHTTWTLLLGSSLLCLSSLAQADLVGVTGSVDYWYTDGDANMAVQSHQPDLPLDQKGSAQLALAIEHPVPLLPNVKIRYGQLENESEQTVAGLPAYDIQLENSDLILYYELLDNIISVDFGVAAKNINADVMQYGITTTKIDETYPMLYGSVSSKFPLTGWSSKTEALVTNVNDARISDIQAEIKYDFIDNLLLDVGAKVGYRVLNIELDDYENNDLKFEFKGPYIGLEADF